MIYAFLSAINGVAIATEGKKYENYEIQKCFSEKYVIFLDYVSNWIIQLSN